MIKLVIDVVKNGDMLILFVKDKYKRICYVVVEIGVDLIKIEYDIKIMFNYFEFYEIKVYFISYDEFLKNY